MRGFPFCLWWDGEIIKCKLSYTVIQSVDVIVPQRSWIIQGHIACSMFTIGKYTLV